MGNDKKGEEEIKIVEKIERKETVVVPIEKEEPIVTAVPHKRDELVPPTPEGDEAWGAIPSFLRRHKK